MRLVHHRHHVHRRAPPFPGRRAENFDPRPRPIVLLGAADSHRCSPVIRVHTCAPEKRAFQTC